MDSLLKRIHFDCLLIILYLIVGFVPYFNAIDKIAPQYVYLSIVSLVSSFYVLFTSEKIAFKKATYVFISFLLFFCWSTLSLFYAINKAEVLIELSRIVIFFIAFINFFFLLNRNRELIKYIPYLVSLLLIVEIFFVYERFFDRYSGINYSRDMGLRAFTGNINITAFSILLKLPFLLNVISRIKINFLIKVFLFSAFTFCLFLLGSRGANLVLILTLIILLLIHLIFKSNSFITNKTVLVILIGTFIGGISNSLFFQNNDSLNVIQRTSNLDTSSTQQRLRFYSAALSSIKENPVFGVGLGNWKLHGTQYDKPFMRDYTVPYHVHNDFLEVTAELGVIGFILYFGMVLWICFLIFQSIKSKEYLRDEMFYLVFIGLISILIYQADSFLNFPFTRPLMHIQNLFFWAMILVILNSNHLTKNTIDFTKTSIKITSLILILTGSLFSIIISHRVFKSFVEQQFLIAAGNGTITDYSKDEVYSIQSELPNIMASTVPIHTAKANIIYNLGYADDTLHYLISQGEKNNPFLPYNDLTRSVLFIKQSKPDSAYVYAKRAFYDITNNTIHFNLLMDIAEAYKDSLEVDKAFSSIKSKDIRNSFYEKYLEVSVNIKNNMGLTENDILQKYNSKNPDNDLSRVYNTIFKVGKKNVEDGYFESLKANDFFKDNKFKEAAESFEKAYSYNSQEVSYYENAANSHMQAGNDKKAIEILKEVITKLNPKTGKAEYLLGIIYIGMKENQTGCEYLYKSKNKGFNVDQFIFSKFCNTKETQ